MTAFGKLGHEALPLGSEAKTGLTFGIDEFFDRPACGSDLRIARHPFRGRQMLVCTGLFLAGDRNYSKVAA